MNFAKNVSSRIFYMDEGIIYEEGPPEQIFENPLREKTRDFVRHVQAFHYRMAAEGFDYVEFLNSLDAFCAKYAVERKRRNRINRFAEELALTMLKPRGLDMALSLRADEQKDEYQLRLSYAGPSYNPLEDADQDELALKMVQGSVKSITYSYKNDENILEALI
jgi:polar amino acid transport system ATP-binding protein